CPSPSSPATSTATAPASAATCTTRTGSRTTRTTAWRTPSPPTGGRPTARAPRPSASASSPSRTEGKTMADDIWILGITMTKFGKHPDKDVVDLGAEAALAALADAGVTMKDMGVLAAGNLMNASAGFGQQLQKQIGQTGIPVYNVANACATGATALRTVIMAVKAGECDMGLAVGVEK